MLYFIHHALIKENDHYLQENKLIKLTIMQTPISLNFIRKSNLQVREQWHFSGYCSKERTWTCRSAVDWPLAPTGGTCWLGPSLSGPGHHRDFCRSSRAGGMNGERYKSRRSVMIMIKMMVIRLINGKYNDSLTKNTNHCNFTPKYNCWIW